MADIVNGRCHDKKAPEKGPPLFEHGKLIVQAHDIGWLVTGIFTIASVVISFWLMGKHLQWYTNKAEQRYIVRILLMVPVYSAVSLASYLFWNHSTPLLLLRDCYESTVLTSFFYLLLMYISPDPEEQKEVFRKVGLSRQNDRERIRSGEVVKKWMFPFGGVRWKPEDGLYFLQLMKWGVLQYCVIRPATTLAAVILDYSGLYCEDSWSPGWGHLYITVIVSISVSVAMYCLLQLYMPISGYLQPQKPLLKLFAVKAVVFLTFWQATGLSMLATFGLVKDSPYMTADNINIGIGAILETVEMTIFAVLHIKAFSYKPYRTTPFPTNRWRALLHAFNFKETLREVCAGTIYMYRRMRGREVDVMARRQAALEGVFGQSRIQIQGGRVGAIVNQKPANKEKDVVAVNVAVEETVHIGEERQWLGVGDNYAYGLGYHSRRPREKSDGLEEQIEQELTSRGVAYRQPSRGRADYTVLQSPEPAPDATQGAPRRRSWWRNVYDRLSMSEPPEKPPQMEPLPYIVEKLPPIESRRAYTPHKTKAVDPRQHYYEDPPPPSAIRSYRESKAKRKTTEPATTYPVLDQPDSEEHPIPNAFQPPRHRVQSNVRILSPSPTVSSQPPTPSSNYSDSFFGRAFMNHSDASHSAEALSATSTSRSYQSRVPLAGNPTMPGTVVVPNMPRLAPPPTSPTFSVNRPLSAIPSDTSRPDSFLARAFPSPAQSDVSQSTDTLSAVVPSSQSHESRVRLPGRPRVVESGEIISGTPRFVHPHESRSPSPDVGSTAPPRRRSAAEWHYAAQEPVPSYSNRSGKHRSLPPTPSTSSPYPLPSANPRSPALVKSRLRRDQIVLPAPLASSASTPSGPPASDSLIPPPGLATPPQLRRSKRSDQRRHTYTSQHRTEDRSSRRVSFPLSHIAEDESLSPSSHQRRNLDSYHS